MRIALALLLALACPAAAQEAAPGGATDAAQNFPAAGEGGLRIVGTDAQYDIVLPADILFDFDEYALRPDARPTLDLLREHFAGIEPDQVHVRGHTDAKGSDQYNLTLSINRATAVCDWLRAEAGLAVTNCMGFGEREPVAPNAAADGSDDPEGRQLNRRVEIGVVIYPDVDAMMEEAGAAAGAALGGIEGAGAAEGAVEGTAGAGAMMDAAQAEAGAALDALEDGRAAAQEALGALDGATE